MPGGHPKKRPKNISRLCNQKHEILVFMEDKEENISDNDGTDGHMEVYGMKLDFAQEYVSDFETDDLDVDEEVEVDEEACFGDDEFSQKVAEMVDREDNADYDWIPDCLLKKKEKHAAER
ncbi:hypothetical protein ID866_13133 [Astraeus odoratus]|nr:hypothetical protein ID866_13133 [Astraeus odoratus]